MPAASDSGKVGRRPGHARPRPGLRATAIAGFLVSALLVAVAMFLTLRTEHHVEKNRTAGNGAVYFGNLLGGIQGQEIASQEYLTGESDVSEVHREFGRATILAETNLGRLRRNPSFSAQAASITPDYVHFHAGALAVIRAVRAGERVKAKRLDHVAVDPVYDGLVTRVSALTAVNAERAGDSAAKLESASETVLLVLPIAFALTGVALFLIARASRRTAREEAKVRARVETLRQAAREDPLTGLGNRRAFEEDLGRAMVEGLGNDGPRCLVAFDVQGLKEVNDAFGHQVGDSKLKEVADVLREVAPAPDDVYRVGGDEFSLLLPGAGAWQGHRTCERIRDLLNTRGTGVNVAAGVAEASPLDSKRELVRRADLALINAKRTHRKLMLYSPELEGSLAVDGVQADEHHLDVLSTALARAVDAKDSYTHDHSETVSNLCVMIATELGLTHDRISKLRRAGLLHDVGKIGTPDAILNKPGKLTADEYAEVQEHPTLGAEIVTAADLPEEADWIRHHHERPDGAGYPDGLLGDEIPLESCIIGVADAFEAMISDRPYRAGRSEAEALEELDRCSWSQFDPQCVAALRRGLEARSVPAGAQRELVANGASPARHPEAGGTLR